MTADSQLLDLLSADLDPRLVPLSIEHCFHSPPASGSRRAKQIDHRFEVLKRLPFPRQTSGANSTHHYGVHISIILAGLIAMVLFAISIFLCYAFADRLAQMLGKTGMTIVVRLSSFTQVRE